MGRRDRAALAARPGGIMHRDALRAIACQRSPTAEALVVRMREGHEQRAPGGLAPEPERVDLVRRELRRCRGVLRALRSWHAASSLGIDGAMIHREGGTSRIYL